MFRSRNVASARLVLLGMSAPVVVGLVVVSVALVMNGTERVAAPVATSSVTPLGATALATALPSEPAPTIVRPSAVPTLSPPAVAVPRAVVPVPICTDAEKATIVAAADAGRRQTQEDYTASVNAVTQNQKQMDQTASQYAPTPVDTSASLTPALDGLKATRDAGLRYFDSAEQEALAACARGEINP